MKYYLLVILSFITLILVGSVELCASKSQPDWAEHLDVIVPALQTVMASAVKIIGGLIGVVFTLSLIIGKSWVNKRERSQVKVLAQQAMIFQKLDAIHGVMMECDGCSDAANRYGRRINDLRVLDAENEHFKVEES